jgi:hypothetical protein
MTWVIPALHVLKAETGMHVAFNEKENFSPKVQFPVASQNVLTENSFKKYPPTFHSLPIMNPVLTVVSHKYQEKK